MCNIWKSDKNFSQHVFFHKEAFYVKIFPRNTFFFLGKRHFKRTKHHFLRQTYPLFYRNPYTCIEKGDTWSHSFKLNWEYRYYQNDGTSTNPFLEPFRTKAFKYLKKKLPESECIERNHSFIRVKKILESLE